MNRRATVSVQITDYVSLISGDVPVEALQRGLSYSWRAVRYRTGQRRGSLWDRSSRTMLVTRRNFWAVSEGLTSRVIEVMRTAGCAVTVEDLRTPLPVLEEHQHFEIGPPMAWELELIRRLERLPMAQILARNHRDRCRVISLFCRTYPKARLLITAASVDEVREIHSDLTLTVPRRVGLVTSRTGSQEIDHRQIVATIGSRALEDVSVWDCVIFAHVEQCAHRKVAACVFETNRHRTFGFVESDRQYSWREQLWYEAFCGGEIFCYSGAEDYRPVYLQPLLTPFRARPRAVNELDHKRRYYWLNDQRNIVVASVATALATRDISVLARYGARDPLEIAALSSLRVVVVVESPEHGRTLKRRLPNWRLLTSENDGRIERPGNLHQTIITVVAAHELNELDVDALIWAGGGRTAPDLPPFVRLRQPAFIFDFVDDYQPAAENAARARLAGFERRGCRRL